MDQLVVLQEIFESYMRGGFPRYIDKKSIKGDCTELIGELLERFQQGHIDEDICHQLMECLTDLYEVKRLGDICRLAGHLGVAVRCYTKALSISSDQHVRSVILNNLGQVHAQQGYLSRAIHQYEKAADGFGSLGDRGGLAHVLGNIGSAYRRSHEWDGAIEYCQRSLAIFQELEDDFGVAQMTGSLGRIYAERGDLDLAIQHYESSLEDFERLGDQRRVAKTLNRLGNVNAEMGRWDVAADYYNRSMKVFDDLGQHQNVGEILSNLGKLHLDGGDLVAARDLLERSVDMIKQNNQPARSNAVSWLAATYSALAYGLHDQALQQISRGESTSETELFLDQASVCYSSASNCYGELSGVSEIVLPDHKLAASMTSFLSYFVLLEAEKKDSEVVELADGAISALNEALASTEGPEKKCVRVLRHSMQGMRDLWLINLTGDEPWKLTEMVADATGHIKEGALYLSESTDIWPRGYCDACGSLYEALSYLGGVGEGLQSETLPADLSDAAAHLRRAEQGFEIAAPDLGMVNAFQVRGARQQIEKMAGMASSEEGGKRPAPVLFQTYQSALLLVGWVLINTAMTGVERTDRVRTWDDSMNLIEEDFPGSLGSGVSKLVEDEFLAPNAFEPRGGLDQKTVDGVDDTAPGVHHTVPMEISPVSRGAPARTAGLPVVGSASDFGQGRSGAEQLHRFGRDLVRFWERLAGEVFRRAKGKKLGRRSQKSIARSVLFRALRLFAALVFLYLMIDLTHYFI